ncbi:cell wall / vacuolar inhibitor of fructosidase 2-like [Impatiens glandulifera]|uniref:cell wall / vacuolar inhibitor of fructosidase 2-like n=1 Tax=Impatiens glandulifera TaxID=253017 RepID=UPI001FB04CD4|nr:cell wall / vacuolar inhibitor of fructosidase 2-like [Impatiens glandulifera]
MYHRSFFFSFSVLIICFSGKYVNGDSALIESVCKSTMYYDLCKSSLASNPTSTNADTKGLAIIMVQIGIVNATSTSSYLSSQALTKTAADAGISNKCNNSSSTTALSKKLNKLCADKYSNAASSLQSSLKELATDEFDYAYVHVMAAADYPRACRTSFRQAPGLAYLPELASREDGLVHICEIVMGILDFLLGSAT